VKALLEVEVKDLSLSLSLSLSLICMVREIGLLEITNLVLKNPIQICS
jgi:hypothetical protein